MIVRSLLFAFVLLFGAAAYAQQVPAELISYPQLILYNGTVLTIDDNFSVATALAIRGGKILAVGSDNQILRLAGPQTRRVDLRGKTVMPGIVDTHVHPNRYALAEYSKELRPEYQLLLRSSGRLKQWESKSQVLADIRGLVQRANPAVPWLVMSAELGGFVEHPVMGQITRKDLDAISPDKPLFISSASMDGIANSKVLNLLVAAYGADLAGVMKDRNGEPTGHVRGAPFYIVGAELRPQVPAEALAPLFRKELIERWGSVGMTTFSTRLSANQARAYVMLDLRGEMPMRLAYGLEVGRWNPQFTRDMNRAVASLPGHGSDRVWLNSISVALPDGSVPEGDICSSFPKLNPISEEDISPKGRCFWQDPGDPTIETVRELTRQGFRVANIHTFGDKGLEIAVDLLEELGVAGRRFAMDHSVMFNERVIEKSGQLGMYWSASAGKFRSDLPVAARGYGRETINRWAFPLKELIEAGAKVTYESSARPNIYAEDYIPGTVQQDRTGPFVDMQQFVTRKDGEGNIWGLQNALDRETALKMLTRWGAEYVLKEKKIGTLEPGKYADLIVLDKNPLDRNLPDQRLSEIRILLTMVEGEAIYTAPGAGL